MTLTDPILVPEPALLGLIGLAAASLGSLLASSLLARRGSQTTQPTALKDDTPTQLATQGAVIPVVLGTREVGPVFTLVDDPADRKVIPETENIPAGGGGLLDSIFGGSSSTSVVTGYQYRQNEVHVLCCACDLAGEMRLAKIRDNDGATVWSGNLSSDAVASGTEVETKRHGTFKIYWGEPNQAQDAQVRDLIGFTTRYPGVITVVWSQARTGNSPQAIPKRYLVTVLPDTSGLGSSSQAGAATLLTGMQEGINPAHALYLLLTAARPFGAAADCDWVDLTTLRLRGLEAEAENIPVNPLIGGEGGFSTVKEARDALMADLSWTFGMSPDGRLATLSRRDDDAYPTFDDDVVINTPESAVTHGGKDVANRVVYEFDDRTREFRTTTITRTEAGNASQQARIVERRRQITTATHPGAAQKIVNRRKQEDLGDNAPVEIHAGRGASLLTPGQRFELADGRVLTTLAVTDRLDGTVDLEAAVDSIGVPAIDDDFGDIPTFVADDAVADLAVAWVQVPAALATGGDTQVWVFRVRAIQAVAGAYIHTAADSGTYTLAGVQRTPAIGGTLDSELSGSTPATVATGPTFEPQNDDAELALDLSTDAGSWNGGRQLLLINDELMFIERIVRVTETPWAASTAYALGDIREPTVDNGLRYVASTAGTSDASEPAWPTTVGVTVTDGGVVWTAHRPAYTLTNLQRAQYGTTRVTHAPGAQLFIVDRLQLSAIDAAAFVDGVTACVKSQPFTRPDLTLDLAGVTPVCRLIGTSTRTTTAGDTRVTSATDTRTVD
ncbi:MAG: hypothetical protein AAGI54_04100 [Planctomycetota bacterium]